jgi:hypothetical protein
MVDTISGAAGSGEVITAPPVRPDQDATLRAWLLEIPRASPAWRHYLLAVVHLRPIDGVRPANKQYPEAEYELMVVALNPDKNPRADDLQTLQHLTPINVVEQFHGVDDEQARQICDAAARAVVGGTLPAEPDGAGRDWWHACLQQMVDHYRQGVH